MRIINRKRFNNFNERRTISVDSEVFLTFEEFMNYYSLAPGKYVGEYDNKPSLRFCCYKPEAEQKKIFPKKIQIGFKTLKDYKQYAKWICEVDLKSYRTEQDARDDRKKWCEVFNKDEKFFENEF